MAKAEGRSHIPFRNSKLILGSAEFLDAGRMIDDWWLMIDDDDDDDDDDGGDDGDDGDDEATPQLFEQNLQVFTFFAGWGAFMSLSKGKEINPMYCTSIVHHSTDLKARPPEPKTLKLYLNRFDFPQRRDSMLSNFRGFLLRISTPEI